MCAIEVASRIKDYYFLAFINQAHNAAIESFRTTIHCDYLIFEALTLVGLFMITSNGFGIIR
jgi:hypothetical protein